MTHFQVINLPLLLNFSYINEDMIGKKRHFLDFKPQPDPLEQGSETPVESLADFRVDSPGLLPQRRCTRGRGEGPAPTGLRHSRSLEGCGGSPEMGGCF